MVGGAPTSVRTVNSSRIDTDRGMSLVEILVSIVLLGTVVIASLVALRTTVVATRIERDHAKAGQWLQSAVQIVNSTPFGDCRVTAGVPNSAEAARLLYQDAIRTQTSPPFGWTGGQISVSNDVQVWTGSGWDPYASVVDCLDDFGTRLQRITIEVRNPGGDIIEDIEVVKSE